MLSDEELLFRLDLVQLILFAIAGLLIIVGFWTRFWED